MAEKTYTVLMTRRDVTARMTNTLEGLIESFSYTLESGRSYDKKVNLTPKTGASLVTALNRAVKSLKCGNYPSHYELQKD